jgi:hypothetical protein
MTTTLKNARQRAAMAAKEERARDAALAMQEYEAEKLAIGIKTGRLRALRLIPYGRAAPSRELQHAIAAIALPVTFQGFTDELFQSR